MRISVVHGFYQSQFPSGENEAVLSQSELLAKAGHDVDLVAIHSDDLVSSPLASIQAAATVATGIGVRIRERIERHKPDIIHVHNTFPFIGTQALKSIAIPTVAFFHNFRQFCAKGTLELRGETCERCRLKGPQHAVINACYQDSRLRSVPWAISPITSRTLLTRRFPTAKAFVSEQMFSYFMSAYPRLGNAYYLPNFVGPPTIKFQPRAPHNWVFVGRISAEKGIFELVNSWPEDTSLQIIGDGPGFHRLQELIVNRENIELVGQMPRDSVREAISRATGLVFPSLWREGLPMVFLEALAAGTPVLAYEGSTVAEGVLSSNAGEVFSDFPAIPGHLSAFASKSSEYAKNAQELWQAEFGPEKWLERLNIIHEKLLGHKEIQRPARDRY